MSDLTSLSLTYLTRMPGRWWDPLIEDVVDCSVDARYKDMESRYDANGSLMMMKMRVYATPPIRSSQQESRGSRRRRQTRGGVKSVKQFLRVRCIAGPGQGQRNAKTGYFLVLCRLRRCPKTLSCEQVIAQATSSEGYSGARSIAAKSS